MPHDTPLIATIVVGLSLAFVLGALAHRLRISPLVGYLLAGVAVGPYTPGFVADQKLATELAEIGVILLMFGVGLHFSLRDLWAVRGIALPGAMAQMAVATAMGTGLGLYLGWSVAAGVVFGLALSVASTVVLLRALQERGLIATEQGRIAVGWLIVEDIAMVLALVLLPTVGPLMAGSIERSLLYGFDWSGIGTTIAVTLLKVAAFVAVMILVGRRVLPWVVHYIAYSGSRELFRLGVLVIALGVAFGAAQLFGVSFALGAFFAGMILGESTLSQRAATETLPLRDAFAVLFFVSVGMLFDPSILVRETLPVIFTVVIIVVGKSLVAMAIVKAFRHPTSTALIIAASLAQIGEFSFILAGLGLWMGILPGPGYDLILAGAMLSIVLNPLIFAAVDRLGAQLAPGEAAPTADMARGTSQGPSEIAADAGRVVLVGYGAVGERIAQALLPRNVLVEALDEQESVIQSIASPGIRGLAGDPAILIGDLDLHRARSMIITLDEAAIAGRIAATARAANPGLPIIARATSTEAATHLADCGATTVVLDCDELASALVRAYASADASR